MYILEKNNTSPLCTLCTPMPQTIPLLTLMLVRTWYEESTPGLIGECHVRLYRDQIICNGSPLGERKEKTQAREHLKTQRLRDSKMSLK